MIQAGPPFLLLSIKEKDKRRFCSQGEIDPKDQNSSKYIGYFKKGVPLQILLEIASLLTFLTKIAYLH